MSSVQNYEKIYILDTNIILEDAHQLLSIGENGKNLVVLPETVIDELDAKKSGMGEINYQAREFGRILSEAEVIKTDKCKDTTDATVMTLLVNDVKICIISMKHYGLHDVDKSVINDRKIIKVAEFATSYFDDPDNTVLLSNDIMCRTRAISLNVKSEGLGRNKEALSHNFVKKLENVPSNEFCVMHGKDITDYDPDYEPQNYCYHFVGTDGNERIGYINKGKIKFIEDSLFNGLTVKPKNMGQRFALAGMLDPDINVCIIEALAGTGKTLLALSAGIKLVQQGKYDKIIYIRNSVESTDKAEEVGFLSGNDEKFKIYNYPLYDTLSFLVQRELKKKDAKCSPEAMEELIQNMIGKYHIETMWNGSIRGRTITNAFVIVDEVQNFAKTSLQTVLSRNDEECKVVCIGSNRQIDHPYINKYTNGLSTLIEAAKEENDEVTVFGSELTKVVRGRITEWTERIFERK